MTAHRTAAAPMAALLAALLPFLPVHAAPDDPAVLPLQTSNVPASAGRETQALADRFFAHLKAGEVDPALKLAFPHLSHGSADDMASLKARVEADLVRFGPPVQWERVQGRALGSFIVRQVWVSQHEAAPLFWTITFYRAPSGWRIQDLSADTRLPGPLA